MPEYLLKANENVATPRQAAPGERRAPALRDSGPPGPRRAELELCAPGRRQQLRRRSRDRRVCRFSGLSPSFQPATRQSADHTNLNVGAASQRLPSAECPTPQGVRRQRSPRNFPRRSRVRDRCGWRQAALRFSRSAPAPDAVQRALANNPLYSLCGFSRPRTLYW